MDQVRVEGFFEARCQELENEVKALVWNNAELDKKNKEMSERVDKLANRQPTWPKSYKPQRQFNSNR
jgi:hypothetical protein|tara:strand:+ start:311 stop:511 length:201 start_codon:yes stop_codon:yes gene_type:complete